MAYSPRAAAHSMIEVAELLDRPVSNLTLHKLLYLAHGLLLARTGKPLVSEPFQAWKYGPVLESLYHDLKVFGQAPIHPNDWFVERWEGLPIDATEEAGAIKEVLGQFGNWTAGQLIRLTHLPDGPWRERFNSSERNASIDNQDIRRYFEKFVRRPSIAAAADAAAA